jgi:UDP-glucose 4-epimerase
VVQAAWLVTGGAGYIGSHIVRVLVASGVRVTVLDDLSTGALERLPPEVDVIEASVLETARLTSVLKAAAVDGIVHVAGKKSPTESISHPLMYHRENVGGVESVLLAMLEAGVSRLVFSSSCSVYGTPVTDTVTESAPLVPESPYGWSKLAGERLIAGTAAAHNMAYVNLRYFNVVGASAPLLADRGKYNLVPLVMSAIREGRSPRIWGSDYPTPDGTCIRDYVHVEDVAEAHALCVQELMRSPLHETFNVGCGRGHSVTEVINSIARSSGQQITPELGPRRPGDPARIVGSVEQIADVLGWKARFNLDEMVASAWQAEAMAGIPD